MNLDDKLFKLWKWSVFAAPLWWFCGLNLLVYHFAAFFMFLILANSYNQTEHPLFIPPSAIFLLSIGFVYLSSIIIHSFSEDASRIVAAFYNLSFWFMGGMLVILLANIFNLSHIPRVLSVFHILCWIMAGFAAFAILMLMMGNRTIIFSTPLYSLGRWLGNTPLVLQSLSVKILQPDWFVYLWRPRLNLFSPYPTATGGILVIVLLLTGTWAAVERRARKLWIVIAFTLALAALFMTLSRMSVMSYAISLMIVFVIQKKRSLPWAIIAFILILTAIPVLSRLLELVLGAREGSNITRIELYQYSLEQLKGADWILGLGIKPREELFDYPLGSHSTYLSLLYKTGLIGFILFLIFQAHLLIRWFRIKAVTIQHREQFLFWRGLGLVFIALAIWILTEDLDAPQFLAFLYFSCIGLYEGFERKLLA